VTLAPLIREHSTATSRLNWPVCTRKTGSSGGRRIFKGWRQRTSPRSGCQREVSADRGPFRRLLHCLAVQTARCSPQWIQYLAAAATEPRATGMENAAITAKVETVFERHRSFNGALRICRNTLHWSRRNERGLLCFLTKSFSSAEQRELLIRGCGQPRPCGTCGGYRSPDSAPTGSCALLNSGSSSHRPIRSAGS
jgi:hypothetical protein